ncbi:ribosome biogenesis GTP-binding protein YihA/YsxC [Helicobacter cappadocius]|uniref:Probable GTP-binding protein EngB n=1 Tax=Helicobacter cappadocius TaxID=3063998 RepID=A0AA90PIX5_9HELI|nr:MULTISPECIES: ribosome biogenesis GTP-binding protein YihA/YsxC [unclassified Helicobacter]MDO7253178.1 ribosome biogenesis GTP-binding protein YihA/YsxC [Helicobacter sp. faydin-H75]MDP2539102.1 ribosome biogenesis GTP-binding protein YihA/YsxC [Helicobacter sp. faydin-H76]
MIIAKESKFVTSARNLAGCPPPDMMEVVFLGRSNVGKSTFINTILEKNLAKSSSTPGKTQLINFFNVVWERKTENSQSIPFRFVDLPGFGYAKVSKETKKDWESNLWNFLNHRTSIKLFVHLIDARHIGLQSDEYVCEIIQKLLRPDQKMLSIYTKFDKLNKNEQHKLYQKGKLVASNNDKIIDKKYGGKDKIREMILDSVLGIETN